MAEESFARKAGLAPNDIMQKQAQKRLRVSSVSTVCMPIRRWDGTPSTYAI